MADIFDIMRARHSVRRYIDRQIEQEKRGALDELAARCNAESGLNIQIIYDEPACFDSMMARYGRIYGVANYIALVGPGGGNLQEKCGYYGEKLVLRAQELGLNTCWIALTYARHRCGAKIGTGEKLCCVIALGYGENQGVPHRSRAREELCMSHEKLPEWFEHGLEAAMLAPTAMNQQKFMLEYENGRAVVRKGRGFYARIDLGIIMCHFEMASGHKITCE